MKKMNIFNLGVFSLISIGLFGCVTTPTPTNEVVTFEKVYEVPGFSQPKLYDGVRQWFAVAYGSANAVIQYEDKAVGTIIGKGNMKYPCSTGFECLGTPDSRIEFTSRIDTKDGKIRVSYDSLRYRIPSKVSSGIRLPEVDNPVHPQTKIGINTLKALEIMSEDMVSKIQNNAKVSSTW